MQKLLSLGWVILFTLSFSAKSAKFPSLKTGSWTGKLTLNETTHLPFKFTVKKTKDKKANTGLILSIFNGEEEIILNNVHFDNDSLRAEFPSFNSILVLHVNTKKSLSGYWQNLNKGVNYKIPCTLNSGYTHRFENYKLLVSNFQPSNFNGRWESTFEPGTNDAYKAVGVFKQNYTAIEGTFLTETGDYRFLEGNVVQDSLYLSCFDGSHAFLFTGKMVSDSIYGQFYSGKHWKSDWLAVKNDDFELTNPDSLTTVIDTALFTLQLKDLEGNTFIFPNEQFTGKVTIIQIMGTWCPNCMDETRYFKELYKQYHEQGLEIIAVGYEVGNSFEEHATKIKTLQQRLDLPFTFLVGGSANKGLASEQFSMLSQIISFPTAIIIDRNGIVRKVHTGFNGPGTGVYYENYVNETDLFIQELLKEN